MKTMNFNIISHIGITLLVILFSSNALAAKTMYKWVNDKGEIYYSDKIPPQESKQERSIINDRGMTVKKIDAAKTREQIEAEARQAKIDAENKRKEAIQDEKDRVLLSTFHDIESIIKARDAKIASIDNTIQITNSTLKSLTKKLQDLTETAAEKERASKKIPGRITKNISEAKKSILNTRDYIKGKENEKEEIRKKYELDIERYKILTTAGTDKD